MKTPPAHPLPLFPLPGAARWALAGVLASALTLGACGGGSSPTDGSDGGGDPGATVTLSGSITIAEASATDSDLNDVNQVNNGYTPNDTVDTAQPLTSPVLLGGTVNVEGAGPTGNNNDAIGRPGVSDPDDVFVIELQAGQVVELEAAAATDVADLDLYVSNATDVVGSSNGVESRFECVQISTAGSYYINVQAFEGASIYNLRIGSAGSGSSCANATATAALGSHPLLARPAAPTSLGTARSGAGVAPALRNQALMREIGLAADAPTDDDAPVGLQLPTRHADRIALAAALRQSVAALRRGELDAASLQRARSTQLGALARRASLAKRPFGSASPSERVEAGFAMLSIAKSLQASGAYAWVQPNWVMQRSALVGTFPPSDPSFAGQRWHYDQIELSTAMNTINALRTQPTQRPVVAVIDSGAMLNHPDLQPQLLNTGCLFANGKVGCGAAIGSGGRNGDTLEVANSELGYHGTHVSGTVLAAAFNRAHGTGVAPMAQLLSLNVFGTNTGASTLDIVNAIRYAARLTNSSGSLPSRRADVINMSLGGGGSCSPAFQEAVTAARNAGVIVVAATGNEARNELRPVRRAPVGQPANCSGVIAVSATGQDRALTSYANTGRQVMITAPGGDGSFAISSTSVVYETDVGPRQPGMDGLMGTSMATPHVAGVMALMRYLNPGLSVAQIDDLIASGAISTDIGATGRDELYGYGLISAAKAVTAALGSGSGGSSPAGQVVAQPANLDAGTFQSSAILSLTTTGSVTDRIGRVTSSNTALVGVSPARVDPATGLGTYRLSFIRNGLAAGATGTAKILVTLTPSGRQLEVPISVSRGMRLTDVGPSASAGPMYVLLLDASTEEVLDTVLVQPSGGRYDWKIEGVASGRAVSVLAGTDLDNDDFIYQPGEVGGAYGGEGSTDSWGYRLTPTADMSGLDFGVESLSGVGVSRAAGSGSVARGLRIHKVRR